MNSDQKNAHTAWSTYGLGMQDSNGAVKSDLIDLNLPMTQVEFAVDYSLHRVSDPELRSEIPMCLDDDEVTVHVRTCGELYGYCRELPHHALASNLAKLFADMTTTKKLPAGTLVRLRPESDASRGSTDTVPEAFFFLGVLCKKPLKHILGKAWMCEGSAPNASGNQVFSMVGDTGMPTFTTSHQAFYGLIQECNGEVPRVRVSIFTAQFPMHTLGPTRVEKLSQWASQ